MSRPRPRRFRVFVGADTLVFLTVVLAILAIGLVITRERTPSALTAPTIAVAETPCQERAVGVGWRVAPIDGTTIPEVTGIVIGGLGGACDGVPLTVTLLDEAGEPIATVSGTPEIGATSLELAFETSVPIPPIADLAVTAADTARLLVRLAGSGSGRVDSDDGAIACPPDCSAGSALGTAVRLTATADAGSVFSGWSGSECASGNPLDPACELVVDRSTVTVVAVFDRATEVPLEPSAGTRVEVTSETEVIDGGFVAFFAPADARGRGIVVRFVRPADLPPADAEPPFDVERARIVDIAVVYSDTGEPVPGPFDICVRGTEPERLWHLEGIWVDVTNPPPADYVGDRVCGLVQTLSPFAVAPYPSGSTGTVNVTVDGEGRVESVPAGIDCPLGECTLEVSAGSLVRLRATPAPGWFLSAWSGACEGSAATCEVRPVPGDGVFVTAYFAQAAGPPVVLTHPSTRTSIAGLTATFAVVSDGTADTYRWQTRAKSTDPWSNVAGGTGRILRWPVKAGQDERRFQVIVRNAYGATVSRQARLLVASIDGVTPGYGPVGRSVRIKGHRLTGASRVNFSGRPSPRVIVVGSTIAFASVPADGQGGSLRIRIPAGWLVVSPRWLVPPGRVAPGIRTVVISGDGRPRPGSVVTLYGRDLVGVTRVTVGGVAATYRVATSALMRITIPASATTFRIVIRSAGGAASSGSGAIVR